MSIPHLTQIAIKERDVTTDSVTIVNHPHHEIHQGDHFFLLYSVVDLGAMGSPDDMITLTWQTSNTAKWGHFTFRTIGSPDWRLRLIEAPTGGISTPTGTLDILNSNRNSPKISTFKDLSGVVGKVSYDATLATGGITLWDEFITGSSGPMSGGLVGGHDEELILMQNTIYQLSIFGTDTDPATLEIGWYEHTNK